ncbi:MAG: hypothetical protein LBU79_07340 [Planctomycetota bacterium]|jgi:hypothetical protein|nr:hypothetical protein [Planctomycetota bacterium]
MTLREVDVTTITAENLLRREPGFFRRRLGRVGTFILILFLAWVAWSWGFCRFYVGPGEMAIITAKFGESLAPGQILAKAGQKGVLEDVLGEGRHIWNPILYNWEIVSAQYIPPGKIGVVTSLIGEDLPAGDFLAELGQKGTWKRVLGPGLYRLNPRGYSIEIHDAISIPMGFAGVVTNLSGVTARPGTFARPGEKGVRSEVLQPGIYYNNPRQYQVAAVEVGLNQVSLQGQTGGMVLTKNIAVDENNQMIQRLNQGVLADQKRRREEYLAESPKAPSPAQGEAEDMLLLEESSSESGFFNDPGYQARQLLSKTLPSPRASRGATADGRPPLPPSRDVLPAFILDQFVNFPSRDGFDITLDMTVEFELRPSNLATIYRDYGDLPQVVDKILMPQVLSVSRLKGSAYRAVDFIAGEGREKFQNDLTDALKTSLEEKNLTIHSALIRNVNVPEQILEPLQTASLSKETNLTNLEKQNTARKQAELNREMSMIQQFGEQVMQETSKLKAEIGAEQKRVVATIQADTGRQVAAIDRDTAGERATRSITLGSAEADSLRLVEEERANGFGMKVRAFKDEEGYALYEFASGLSPELRINLIHAGEGTLWTDMRQATLGELGGAKILQDGN